MIEQAIAYFEDAIRESDEIIADCSEALQAELTERKRHFEVALECMRRANQRKPIELTNRYPDGQFACPVCGCGVGYPTFKNTPFGEMRCGDHKSSYCLNCGQKIDWEVQE